MTIFQIIIAAGAALTLAGLAGIIWCILAARAAKQDLHDEAELRSRLQRIVSVNMGALMASLLGLMLTVLGIVLGG